MQLQRISIPPWQSGSPCLGGGRYFPVNKAEISELTSTPDTCVHPEESIRYMTLLPRGYEVDVNLTYNGQNELDNRSYGDVVLLILADFIRGGGGEVRRGDRYAV